MSKASEWAKRVAATKQGAPTFQYGNHHGMAKVTDDGRCYIGWHEPVTADEILALADWIKETFGEPDK